ncbi:unnamed protein product [Moneuplotes crassus]|uniref:Uncharacterized protein n=1 Tax=Euplotes crassus TaxID=5936 RepID=A0AAD1UF35_EUPCR|nr:unnamed protein product [Moneuplotes crassus]
MSDYSDHSDTDKYIEKSFEDYNREASKIYDEDSNGPFASSPKVAKGGAKISFKSKKKKIMTKDDIIDKMRDLNTRARDQLKGLNTRMERILETMKYKIIHKQQLKQKQVVETPKHKHKVLNSEISQLQQQKEQLLLDQEQWAVKLQEAINYRPQNTVKKDPNTELLKKTIRDLKKEIKDQEKILVQNNNPEPKAYKPMEANERYLILLNKNLVIQDTIERKETSLSQHEDLIQRNMLQLQQIQKCINSIQAKRSRRAESQLKRHENRSQEIPKKETQQELLQKIKEISEKIKQDDKEFSKKKRNMDKKLSLKHKELQLAKLRLKEKDQERRIGNLKVQELRRILKQHKLQPLVSSNEKFREQKRTERNKSLIVHQSQSSISKTFDLEYGKPYIEKKNTEKFNQEDSKKSSRFRLAKVEWKYNGKKLHQSSVDLREKDLAEKLKNNKRSNSKNDKNTIQINTNAPIQQSNFSGVKKKPSIRMENEKVSNTGGSGIEDFYQNTVN